MRTTAPRALSGQCRPVGQTASQHGAVEAAAKEAEREKAEKAREADLAAEEVERKRLEEEKKQGEAAVANAKRLEEERRAKERSSALFDPAQYNLGDFQEMFVKERIKTVQDFLDFALAVGEDEKFAEQVGVVWKSRRAIQQAVEKIYGSFAEIL